MKQQIFTYSSGMGSKKLEWNEFQKLSSLVLTRLSCSYFKTCHKNVSAGVLLSNRTEGFEWTGR